MKNKIVLIIFFVLAVGLFSPALVYSADEQVDIIKPDLVVPIGDVTELSDIAKRQCIGGSAKEGDQCYYIPWIAEYVQALYRYGVGLGSVLAVIIFVVSGGMYMTSGLNPAMQQKAKTFMTSAVLGLLLLLGSYTMLKIINPDLVVLKPIEVQVLKRKEVPDTFCDMVKKSEYFEVGELADKRTPVLENKALYSQGGAKYMRCGVEYAVSVRKEHKTTISAPVGSICRGGKCQDTNEYCKFFGGSARCIPALIHGYILDSDGNFNRSLSQRAADVFDDLEIDKSYFAIMHHEAKWYGWDEVLQSVESNYVPERKSYYFSVNEDTASWDKQASKQDWPIYLRVQVNYAGVATRDRIYYVDATGSPIGFADSGKKCCTYISDSGGTQGLSVKPGCTLFKVKDLQDAQKIDLDLDKFLTSFGQPLKASFIFETTLRNRPTCGSQQAGTISYK
jgi:hypothetical protein